MLFLLTIGFFGGIPVMLMFLIQDVNIIFFTGQWAELTTSGTAGYHSILAPLVIFEFFGKVLIFIYTIIVAVNYFQKRNRAPKMIVVLFIINIIFQIIILSVGTYIISIPNKLALDIQNILFKVIIGGAIYIPYLLSSKKVKEIFVN